MCMFKGVLERQTNMVHLFGKGERGKRAEEQVCLHYTSIYIYLSTYIYLSIHPSIHLSIYLSIYIYIYIYI